MSDAQAIGSVFVRKNHWATIQPEQLWRFGYHAFKLGLTIGVGTRPGSDRIIVELHGDENKIDEMLTTRPDLEKP